MTPIPVIDMRAAFAGDPDALEATATQLREACEQVGFLYISGHGVDAAVVDDTFTAAARFHAQPLEDKLSVRINEHMQGYMPMRSSTSRASGLSGNSKPNENEAFFLQREIAPEHPGFGHPPRTPNVWPAELPGFRDTVLSYYAAMDALIARLLPVYARALELPADYFVGGFQESMSTLRLTHYPATEYDENSFGVAPHTDSSFITLLAQNKVSGLQLMTQAGEWIDAPSIDGTFVVNTGDLLHRWSNGRFLSTPHRAYNKSGAERYAIPFFCHPDPDYVMRCMPSCTSPDKPPQFPDMSALQYMSWFNGKNYHHVQKSEAVQA